MGAIKSKTKYVLLYGDKESGKTLMQYNLQSSLNVFEKLEPTEGFNYEEINLKNTIVGMFDVSGDLKQYEIVNIINKCVNITGVIYMVSLNKIEELDKSKAMLKLILCNKHLKENVSLLVVYNLHNKLRDQLSWMTTELLDNRMKLNKMKEKFNLNFISSCISDVSLNNNNYVSNNDNFSSSLEEFVLSLDNPNINNNN